MIDKTRRDLLRSGLLFAVSPLLLKTTACSGGRFALLEPDSNGVRLPDGFNSRILARSGQPVLSAEGYFWHDAPDGGECMSDPESGYGWIYVNNSELNDGFGGAGALRFNRAGDVIDAYSILEGTSRNCAGGLTPWATWLSCEETDNGLVWECDPLGNTEAIVRPALGRFMHEAVATDPVRKQLYLTEDKPDGGLYRFTPDTWGDLSAGVLEAAVTRSSSDKGMTVDWQAIPDPDAAEEPTRYQLENMARFDGGEGIVYTGDKLYFTTKGDDSVWQLNPGNSQLRRVYHAAEHTWPVLTGVDNITADTFGNLFVAEDGGDMQVVMLSASGKVMPIAQVPGHSASEITGVAFSPDGSRLYFNSQRGEGGESSDGVTFEITGPFDIL